MIREAQVVIYATFPFFSFAIRKLRGGLALTRACQWLVYARTANRIAKTTQPTAAAELESREALNGQSVCAERKRGVTSEECPKKAGCSVAVL